MNTPPAVRCTVHPPRWAERCPSVSQPPLALYTTAHDHAESHLGSSLSKHCHYYTSAGCIFSAPHPFLPSPPSPLARSWIFLLRRRILYPATAAGPVFWHLWEWRGHGGISLEYFEKLSLLWDCTCAVYQKLYHKVSSQCVWKLFDNLNLVQAHLLAQSARHRSRSCSTSASSSFCLARQPSSRASRCSRPLFSMTVNSLSCSAASLRLLSIAIWLCRVWTVRWRAWFSASGSWCPSRPEKEPRGDQSPSMRRLSWARCLNQNGPMSINVWKYHFQGKKKTKHWDHNRSIFALKCIHLQQTKV